MTHLTKISGRAPCLIKPGLDPHSYTFWPGSETLPFPQISPEIQIPAPNGKVQENPKISQSQN